jgi:adenine-specific DNA-methyltransferase
MTPYYEDEDVTIYHGDSLEILPQIEAADLILTDPPYFKVKAEEWDRQWKQADQFLQWLDTALEQVHRIMAANGSLYLFASPQMAARVEVLIGQRFAVLNSITWAKPNPFCEINPGASNAGRVGKASLRTFYPNTERIIFAEHHGADNMAKGEAGYAAKCDELRGFVFEPLRAYLADEWKRAGLTKKDADLATGTQMASHYLTRSQWALPTEANYEKLRAYANRNGNEYLRRDYEDLRRDYEDLRTEYEELRRPFSVTADVPFTDVWTFPTVQAYPGKHPCEKPQSMLDHIIKASSREGMTVLDPFMGSGSTLIAARATGRKAIGIEKDERWCERAAAHFDQQVLAAA